MNPKEPRTIMIANQPSLDADRHLHVYLAEASRRAQLDVDFGARLTELGVDLSGISEENAVALARAVKPGPRGEGLVCRTFWWGFHLEIPSAEVEELASLGISHATLVRMLEVVPHRMAPHLGTLVEYITENFETIKCTDRGVGVLISMSSFAPDLYVVTAAPSRHAARRSSEPSDLCVVRM